MKSKKTTQTKINVKAKTTRSQAKDLLYLKMNSLFGILDWDGQNKKSEYVCAVKGNGETFEVTNASICRLLKNEICSDMQMDPYMSLLSKELNFDYIGPLITCHWIQNARPSRAQGFSQRKIEKSNEKKELMKKLFSHSSSKGVVMIVHDPESLYHWFTVIMMRSSSRAVEFIVSDSMGSDKVAVSNLIYQ